MIINERKFVSDTKSFNSFSIILDSAIKKALTNDAYIFISHKHGEVKLVYHLKALLDIYEFKGYVDWEDSAMPEATSAETAARIKEKN